MGTTPAPVKNGKKSKRDADTAVAAASEASKVPFDPTTAPGGSANPNAVPVSGKRRRRTVEYSSGTKIVPVVAVKAAEAKADVAGTGAGGVQDARKRDRGGPPKVEQGMHPSWEAKRRAQEALQAVASAPKGKKIVFD